MTSNKIFKKRLAAERGLTHNDWLKSFHTFSFGDYFDENSLGFSTLRVINEDRIAGGQGFGLHPHKDMEIITYIINGALEHKDSLGNVSLISRDEVQVMSAGSGIKHSEYNSLKNDETHFLQIWILPEKKGVTPKYGQKSFKQAFLKKNFVLVASRDAREESITINQDADVYVGRFKAREEMNFKVRNGRHIWIQIIDGEITVNDLTLHSGDGLAIANEELLNIKAQLNTEFILFDLN